MCDGEILKAFPLIAGQTRALILTPCVHRCAGDPRPHNKAGKGKGQHSCKGGKQSTYLQT